MAGGSNNFKIGLVSELKAQMYYANKWYEIFTPIMSQGHADFVALKGKEVLKIQVKKATENPANSGVYLQVRIQGIMSVHSGCTREYDEDSFYILSIIYKDRIWNLPIELVLNKKSMTFGKVNDEGVVESRLDEYLDKLEY